ncbi:MAG: metallophosphoesterase [Alphaproteobacteria bacterium]|nr:metallophosphoesterase [Alphaproteobacteria bacterium]
MLYYAIGDVHGCAAQLDKLLKKVNADAATRADGRDWRIVMLGDYVDRGPDSAGVLDRVMALDAAGHVVLPGNHEQLMHDALNARPAVLETAADGWWRNGGKQTLMSYGAKRLSRRRAWRSFECVPDRHRAFLKTLLEERPVHFRDDEDGLFFVHAGVRPDTPLSDTRPEVLLWSRARDFMSRKGKSWVEGLRVVHGHTPADAPDVCKHRVGLDTGAVYGGMLTCGVFDGGGLVKVLSVAGLRR